MPTSSPRPGRVFPVARAVVIGAGVSGLAAAWRLQRHGVRVTVVEATDHVGGQVRTVPFDGRAVDVGAEGLHLAGTSTATTLAQLGLLESAVSARTGGTWLERGGRLRRLPEGVGPAGPTRLQPVLASGVLSPLALARAGLEPLLARRRVVGDVAVGDFVARRFGRQVVDRFVDPLLGGIHAGDVGRLSLAACAPQLVDVAAQGRSIVLRRRSPAPTSPPSGQTPTGLVSWPDGLQRLPAELASRLTEPVRLGEAVRALGWRGTTACEVELASGEILDADVVVLATPATVAADLLAPTAPGAAAALRLVQTASVATVIASFAHPLLAQHPALRGTGILLPSGGGHLLRAATFLSTKWPHLTGDQPLVRLSAGRAGDPRLDTLTDDALADRLVAELGTLLGLRLEPSEVSVHRWPRSMPQQEVGHRQLVATARERLVDLPQVALAGASYDGVGVAACLRSGELAAEALLGRSAAAQVVA
ncbi:MAG TPA: protoporphyrinogen oxidase [Angustibacter sp.]|nr:protoporphyrinogen oxidase [Angustibacter sp.]